MAQRLLLLLIQLPGKSQRQQLKWPEQPGEPPKLLLQPVRSPLTSLSQQPLPVQWPQQAVFLKQLPGQSQTQQLVWPEQPEEPLQRLPLHSQQLPQSQQPVLKVKQANSRQIQPGMQNTAELFVPSCLSLWHISKFEIFNSNYNISLYKQWNNFSSRHTKNVVGGETTCNITF